MQSDCLESSYHPSPVHSTLLTAIEIKANSLGVGLLAVDRRLARTIGNVDHINTLLDFSRGVRKLIAIEYFKYCSVLPHALVEVETTLHYIAVLSVVIITSPCGTHSEKGAWSIQAS